ncbi:MAG: hypothetical protein ACTHQ3_04440 [Motilibacteraceae bacterium]
MHDQGSGAGVWAAPAAGRDRRLRGLALLAAAGLVVGALAGCSGSSSGTSGPSTSTSAGMGSSTAPSTGATGGTTGAVSPAHASPAAVVTAFYQAVAQNDLATGCSLIDPSVIPQLLLKFGSCQLALKQHYTDALRAQLKDVKVDEGAVKIAGDGAFVPQDAITFGGQPSKDGDQQAIRLNGKWFLSSPASSSQ